MSAAERVQVPGSERTIQSGHERVGEVDEQAPIEVTLYLRPRAAPDWVDGEAELAPNERRRVDRQSWAAEHGADPADIDAVTSFAGTVGLEVVGSDPARRTVTLRGPLADVARAFGATLEGRFRTPEGAEYRGRSGAITIPAGLNGIVTGVYGIDDRPQARPHLRRLAPAAAPASLTALQVAEAYAFPAQTTGAGQTIAILELGGGFSQSDLDTYFSGLGISPAPSVTAVSVGGAQNSPGVDQGADGEVMLDIEVAGAVAPGAKIAVYFASNTDQGFINGLSSAVHDTTTNPSVVSISWGGPEDSWSQQSRQQMEQIMIEAAGLGVSVTVAAGDTGSTDGVSDGKQHVDFPASAPHALACGGTRLELSGTTVTAETVWNDSPSSATGGGVSTVFPAPSYQAAAHVPNNVDTGTSGRGVPDVCGDADPQSGYEVLVDGNRQVIGGTSAVAPLWAGLVARLNEHLGAPVGFAQPRLYPLLGSASFHDITQGDNGAYHAGPGWDACSGLGSPDGTALAAAIGAPAATGAAAHRQPSGHGHPTPQT